MDTGVERGSCKSLRAPEPAGRWSNPPRKFDPVGDVGRGSRPGIGFPHGFESSCAQFVIRSRVRVGTRRAGAVVRRESDEDVATVGDARRCGGARRIVCSG